MPNQYAQPNLGYGKQTEASINTVNQWMRSQPWYQQIRGTSPKLNDSQRTQILRAAQAHGVVIDEGDMEVDPTGNLNPKGHKLRNSIIVGGIAAAAIVAPYAIHAIAGAAGAGGGGAAAAGGFSTAAGAGGFTAGVPSAIGGGTAAAAGGGAGFGTAATIAGAAGGASKVKNWLAPLLQVGVPVAGNLIGAGMETRANTNAAEINDKYLRDALKVATDERDFDRKTDADRYAYSTNLEASRYADLTGRLSPYLAAGASASDRQSQLLGLPARPQTAAPIPAPVAPTGPAAPGQGSGVNQAPIVSQPQPAAPPQPMGAEPLVTMVAPNGQQKQVKQSEVAHYTQLGAKVIQAA